MANSKLNKDNVEINFAIPEDLHVIFIGSVYGIIHTLTGHPFDTIKTKLQVKLGYSKLSTFEVMTKIWKSEGLKGFYCGCVPP